MSKLQALATLVGLSREYESELSKLEEARYKISEVLKLRRSQLAKLSKMYPEIGESADPDAKFYEKFRVLLDEIEYLDDSIDLLDGFVKGVLKYE